MGARWLLAVTAAVAVAHGVLLLALARHGSTQAVAHASSRGARWIVLAAPKRDGGPVARAATAAPAEARAARRGESRSRAAEATADAMAVAPSRARALAPADRIAAIGIYRAATALDVPVRARSAPDITQLAGLPGSGLPLRMRLFIDAEGTVVDARILQSAESDDVAERVRRMFLATGFTAGVQSGRPVPSYKDIELTIATPS